MGKGNDRNPELANDETTDLVWAWGGVSDHTWISVRFGNTPVGDDILAHGAYFDWGYARDVNNKDSKYPGNHYFYGVSFRTGQGGRYALCIDRSSYDNILGAYGETRTSVLTTLITDTTAAVPEEVVSPNPSVGINGVSFKIKTTDTSGAFNVRTTPWTIGATVTATSGGSFKIEGVGFDGSNQFFITKTVTGTVGSGDTLTQAAGQAIAETAVSNDRTQQTSVNGQLIVTTASNTSSHTGTRSLLYPRAIIAGMLIREDEISALVQGSINMTSTGTHALESAGTIKTTGATNEIRSTGSQVNLYTDSGVSNVRLRWAGTSLDSYTGADLGSSARRWDTLFATNGTINTSDEREKTELLELDAKETACAKELKSAIRKFKFNDAVTKKGDKARIHFGVGAQTVGDIFRSNDLNPNEYAIFCYDEWDEELEENEAGEMVLTQESGNRYGIRYEELLCFIVSAL
jgi:hypothetical protein